MEDTKEQSFAVGDVIWGSAHGSPSWPGKLVKFSDEKSKVLVRWFGVNKTPSMVEVTTLQTLTEGLDAHHRARKKCRKSRKLNTQLENAIQEAMGELDRMSEKTQPTLKEAEKLQEKKNHNLKTAARPR